jgi:DNA-binding NarL/FixJ family response regulator
MKTDYTIKPPKTELTPCERTVLGHIAEGLASKEVADRLFVSKRTVDFHLDNIYDKFGVRNRLQAVNAARRAGILN